MAGFLAAIMGASSSVTNSAAAIFTLGVYKRFLRPQASEEALVRTGRWASTLVLLVAAAWCPLIGRAETIFTYFQTGVTYLATPFIAVSLVGILLRRPGPRAGAIGVGGGIVIQILAALAAKFATAQGYVGQEIHWLYVAFVAQVLTMLLVVAVGFVTPPAPAAKSNCLFGGRRWSSPVGVEAAVGTSRCCCGYRCTH